MCLISLDYSLKAPGARLALPSLFELKVISLALGKTGLSFKKGRGGQSATWWKGGPQLSGWEKTIEFCRKLDLPIQGLSVRLWFFTSLFN